MNWHKVSDWCIRSDCMSYTVTKMLSRGVAEYWLWRGKTHLSSHKTGAAAKCEAEGLTMQEAA